MISSICAHFGESDDCPECGGYRPGHRVDMFCSDGCAADFQTRRDARDAAVAARRAREDAFGAAVDRLHALGYTYEQMDVLLAGMPT